MDRKYISYFAKIILLFSVYFVTAKFGLSLDAVGKFATLIWFPSGITLVAFLLFGNNLWPAVVAGAFFVNLLTGAPPLVAIGISIGNTLEGLTAAYLLKRSGFGLAFNHLADVLQLLIITPLSTSISATIGVSSLFLAKIIAPSMYYPAWIAWWLGDMISIIILTPLLLSWSSGSIRIPNSKRAIEVCLLGVCVLLVGSIIFSGVFHISTNSSPVIYLVFPPLIWASLRFGQRGALTSVFALSIIAVISTIQDIGPFAVGRLSERLLFLQSFMGVITVTSMVLAAVDMQRREFEQRKDEFINLASHELKTPITSIKVFIQILLKKDVDKPHTQHSRYLAKLNGQIDKLTFLINDLLDTSKIQQGKLEFNMEYFSLRDLAMDCIDVIQATTDTHTLVMKDTVKNKTIIVYADKERINQVISNLLTNAIKYSPNARRVIVTLQIKNKKAIVGVKDFGIGISSEHHNRIFERYYRASDEPNKTFPGLGIGLYIAHEIIKRSNGNMWVESQKAKGSTFYFSLSTVS